MSNRDRLFQLFIALATAAAAAFLARYGIKLPEMPPITVNPPAVVPPIIDGPDIKPPSPSKPDAWAAIGRIQFGNAGCTATVIGPRREDGRWWVLTASHCVARVGQLGTMRFKDGRTTGLKVAALDRTSDCCWCFTESNTEIFPFAVLARHSPEPGTKIWHGGYGYDKPGNREEGTIKSKPGQNGQISMELSVSSGDSGGGIALNSNNEVVSCVCCTSQIGGVGTVWGASPESIQRLKPTVMVLEDWTPIEIPLRKEP